MRIIDCKAFINNVLLVFSMFFIIFSCSSRTRGGVYRHTNVSFYADRFQGKPTSSGEIYRHSSMTASHGSLAFGTKVEIVNVENEKSVTVTVNDRGPLKSSRAFDLSQDAFKKIARLDQGVVKVKYRILK